MTTRTITMRITTAALYAARVIDRGQVSVQ